jgi:hypothetical protein
LLTGKFVSVELEGEKPEVTLMTPDEVAALIREKAGKAEVEIEIPLAETEGGEGDA